MMILKKLNPDDKKWFLEGSSGSGKNYIIPIDKNPFIIGRSNDCHLILSSKDVSRKHARIVLKGDYLYLSDLKSTNGTFKNKVRISEEVLIGNGDIIHFGNVKFNVFTTEEGNEEAVPKTSFEDDPKEKEDDFAQYYELSLREKEILYLLLEGKSTKIIADKLCIADGTAKNHVIKIFKKTGTHSRVSLVNKFNAFQTLS